MGWMEHVRADPLPWLLAEDTPAVRATALQRLLDMEPTAPEVCTARRAAMGADPIKSILAAQNPAGWWVKPGPGHDWWLRRVRRGYGTNPATGECDPLPQRQPVACPHRLSAPR
jgi:hypothetical protein